MIQLYYNLQDVITSLKKLEILFTTDDKLTSYHLDVNNLYHYYHHDQPIDYLKCHKHFPKQYMDLMFLEYLKTTKLSLIVIPPINYHKQYNVDQIEYYREIKLSKIAFNKLLRCIYQNDGPLIEKTNKYYCDNPIKIYFVSDITLKDKDILKIDNNRQIFNIASQLLHFNQFNNEPDLLHYMRDLLMDLELIDSCCFIIIDNKLNVITLQPLYIDVDSMDIPYYQKKEIIYNPLKHYYYNGLKFVKDKKSVKELIECFS